jgi:cytochrome P450 family 4
MIDHFFIQGHDTTSVGICWALFMIGLHDDVQEKIFNEMNEIFGEETKTSPKRIATFRDLNEMKYLERTLKECLRLYPSVPNISRKMNEDIVIGTKYFIAKTKVL